MFCNAGVPRRGVNGRNKCNRKIKKIEGKTVFTGCCLEGEPAQRERRRKDARDASSRTPGSPLSLAISPLDT